MRLQRRKICFRKCSLIWRFFYYTIFIKKIQVGGKIILFGINIIGTGSYTPAISVDNEAMSGIVETNDEWITTRTGIKTRFMADGEPVWYMGACAARQAIEAAGISPEEI